MIQANGELYMYFFIFIVSLVCSVRKCVNHSRLSRLSKHEKRLIEVDLTDGYETEEMEYGVYE